MTIIDGRERGAMLEGDAEMVMRPEEQEGSRASRGHSYMSEEVEITAVSRSISV